MDLRALLELVRAGAQRPVVCIGCGHPADPSGDYCPSCGKRIRAPCAGCGVPCTAGMKFCPSCGDPLDADRALEADDTPDQRDQRRRQERQQDLLGRFRHQEILEDGRVRHLEGVGPDGRRAFVKVAASTEGRRLLANELDRLAAMGAHPGLPRLLGQQWSDEHIVAVFEHHPRHALRFPLAIPRLLGLVSATLDVLIHAHAHGVVHADLKPAHLWIGEDDTPVLVGWGIAQAPGPSLLDAYTPMFAAPEQVVGDHVDPRADLYALGVIMYLWLTHDRFPSIVGPVAASPAMHEVLHARRPTTQAMHDGDRPEEVDSRQILGAKFQFGAELRRTAQVNAGIGLSTAILRIVRRATAVDPADRFADAATMKAAVDAVSTASEGAADDRA